MYHHGVSLLSDFWDEVLNASPNVSTPYDTSFGNEDTFQSSMILETFLLFEAFDPIRIVNLPDSSVASDVFLIKDGLWSSD